MRNDKAQRVPAWLVALVSVGLALTVVAVGLWLYSAWVRADDYSRSLNDAQKMIERQP